MGRLIPAGTGAYVNGVKRVAADRDAVALEAQQAEQAAIEAAAAGEEQAAIEGSEAGDEAIAS